MTTYKAVAERSGSWWAVSVPDLPGVFTQGRTWTQAHEMAREAIAAMLDLPPDEVSVELSPMLPDHAERVLDELAGAHARKAAAVAAEAETLRKAALQLKHSGVSVRDAGAILGISYQRVSQLTNGTAALASRPSIKNRKTSSIAPS